jgi:hypothetical protein
MALLSPGVEISIIDESQYVPAATNSVPYILLATAQNKVSGAGVGVAPGTLQVNANKIYLMTSQRDLMATFGVPFFYKTTAGTPINGYELNEYGLLAAYSALGVSNRCYVQRVDVDLSELTASLVRPTAAPPNGSYWFDTTESLWGIFEWSQVTDAFSNKVPSVITNTSLLFPDSTVPLQSYGSIGDYAVVATTVYNPSYFKRGGPTASETNAVYDGQSFSDLYNTWVLVGSDEWKTSWPTIQGSKAPGSLTNGQDIVVNGVTVAVGDGGTATTVTGLMQAINAAAISGVYVANVGGKLTFYCDSTTVLSDSTDEGGAVEIGALSNSTLLTALGISVGTYRAPEYRHAPSYQVPRWRDSDQRPEPTGSIWQKFNSVSLGTNLAVKQYNDTLGLWVLQNCPVYNNDAAANNTLDPSGGGKNIPVGTLYAQIDYDDANTSNFEILSRFATGATNITGSTTTPGPFVASTTFTISATAPGSSTFSAPVTATVTGTFVNDFVAAVSAANVPYVSASINSAGAVVLTHSAGGDIVVKNISGTPLTLAGFTLSTQQVRPFYLLGVDAGLLLSNWVGSPEFSYTASSTAPDQDPANGRLWYYSSVNQADIMIQNNGQWRGYQTVANDVRGDNLTLTNASGPLFSATPPLTQNNDAQSQLVPGDLWIDTSDLENYPAIYRWTADASGDNEWIRIDNTDQTGENGILFADARWANYPSIDPVSDPYPSIETLLTNNYLDIDAPSAALYPQGMLLFNTRRSGFNVKSFQQNYFNSTNFDIPLYSSTVTYTFNNFVLYNGVVYAHIGASPTTGVVPTTLGTWAPVNTNTWLTASGNKEDGSPNMGRQAQRALIVQALKAGIDSNTTIREEQNQFNLIACPQYPELTVNMVALNNERNNTAFVIADTPLRLSPEEVVTFATNNAGLGLPSQDTLTTGNAYCGAFYPSCTTTDLSGSTVVQPPSHMMVRTIIRSDEVAFPWLAPAGTRRGVVDNAQQIGYINAVTGEFLTLGVNQGLRDVLYENRINPITFVPGVGITNFGNKTVTSVDSALNRINVARLIAFIRGRLEVIAKQYLFEPNDQITRNEITNSINSLMIDLIAKRGIYDYLVICDLTNNTPARIDNNELWVDIAIEPVKAVEFIYIPVRIKNTGEISAGQSV